MLTTGMGQAVSQIAYPSSGFAPLSTGHTPAVPIPVMPSGVPSGVYPPSGILPIAIGGPSGLATSTPWWLRAFSSQPLTLLAPAAGAFIGYKMGRAMGAVIGVVLGVVAVEVYALGGRSLLDSPQQATSWGSPPIITPPTSGVTHGTATFYPSQPQSGQMIPLMTGPVPVAASQGDAAYQAALQRYGFV